MAERALKSTDRQLAPAVAETVANLDLAPEDVGLARLACTYAEQLDRAAGAAAQAEHVLSAARAQAPDDVDLGEAVAALKVRLGERAAVENLGPKLLAALEALGATPKVRASLAKGGAARGGRGKLAALREGRAS